MSEQHLQPCYVWLVAIAMYGWPLTRKHSHVDKIWPLFDSIAMADNYGFGNDFRLPKRWSQLSGTVLDSSFRLGFVSAGNVILSFRHHLLTRTTHVEVADKYGVP
jgi:hypothetical protein